VTATIPAPPPPAPADAAPVRRTPGTPPRLLVPLTGREGALAVLDEAHASARETGREVHTALLLPRTPLTRDAERLARFGEVTDREATELVALATQRAAAAGVPARITVHRLRGLHGRRRQRVLDRAVARLARRLDAVPVGRPAP
jgi:nucleotide-binding universal stress UspA family protein